MGRNKNKDKRSASRQAQQQRNGKSLGGANPSSRKDTGPSDYFKHRKRQQQALIQQMQAAKQRDEDGDMSMNVSIEEDPEEEASPPFTFSMGATSSSSSSLNDAAAFEAANGASSSSSSFEMEKAARDLALTGKRDSSAKAFMKDMRTVVDNADVLLQVLDARDPLGSRSRQTETLAMGMGKKVVLILNKVDLVPRDNLEAWLKYLRHDFPTLAFKASTQAQRSNLKQGRAEVVTGGGGKNGSAAITSGTEAIGAASLLSLLKNYARTSRASKGKDIKAHLTVGVVGPPNVGKSSLINSLLRTRACAVAATPGWTKSVQGVALEKGIRLLDCPGIVVGGHFEGAPSAGDKAEEAWNVLRNTIKVELIEDPIAPINAMLDRVDSQQLVDLYKIEGGFNEGDAHDFLLRLALVRGKLGRGGIPDLEGAARIVLHDWNVGKIRYFTKVPAVHRSMMKTNESAAAVPAADSAGETAVAQQEQEVNGASLVSGFGEAFDLAALLGEADAELVGMGTGMGGKNLKDAPERRYAEEEAENEGENTQIVEDDDGAVPEESGDTSLGKRQRGSHDSDSEDEDDDDVAEELGSVLGDDETSLKDDVRPRVRFEDDDDLASMKRTELSKRTAHRRTAKEMELGQMFSEAEMSGMVLVKPAAQRKRELKKKRRREERSGAGLVDVWEQGMELDTAKSHAKGTAEGAAKGQEGGEGKNDKPRGMFDLLVAPEGERQQDSTPQPQPPVADEDEEEL